MNRSRLALWLFALLMFGHANADGVQSEALTQAGVNSSTARLNYMLNCQGCHAPDGRGLNDIPAMADFVGKFLRVEGGRGYLVQVPGSANSPLNDAELAEVLNWVLITMSQPQLPDRFTPFTATEVSQFRQQPLNDAAATRARLLELMEKD